MPFLAEHWRTAAVLALFAVILAWGATMRFQRDASRVEFATFKRQVAEAAQKASEVALQRTIADEQRKEAADAEHAQALAALNARIASLRARRADRGFVPAAPSCPERPASACLDRAELERALRDLDRGVQELVDEGSRAVTDLDSAKRWAQEH